jgi:hypothetical protein
MSNELKSKFEDYTFGVDDLQLLEIVLRLALELGSGIELLVGVG